MGRDYATTPMRPYNKLQPGRGLKHAWMRQHILTPLMNIDYNKNGDSFEYKINMISN